VPSPTKPEPLTMPDIVIGQKSEPKHYRDTNPQGTRASLDTDPPPATRMPDGVTLAPIPLVSKPAMLQQGMTPPAQIIPGVANGLAGLRRQW
jgi:hypothetical protein